MPNEIIPISTAEANPVLQSLMKPCPGERHLSMPTPGGTNAYVEWRFEQSWPTLEIIQITDAQFGSRFCIVEKLIEFRDWVLARPNRFMVWGGDMVEAYNFLKSPGTPYEQIADPQSCIGAFVRLWAPARHRVLGYVGGNHERRHTAFGDLGIFISNLLELPYALGRQHIVVYFGEHKPFKIALWHGSGSARTTGSIANLIERQTEMDDSDLFLMGHLHRSLTLDLTRVVLDTEARGERVYTRWGAMGSSFLAHHGSYADVAGYKQRQVKMPLAVLRRDGKWSLSLK